MAEEERASRPKGVTIGEALVWLALIAAAVALIVTGNGDWVIGLLILAFIFV